MRRIKKLLAVMLALSFLVTMFPVSSHAKGSDVIPNDKTGIPDKGLYQAILEALNRKGGVFTKAEAARITSLDAYNYKKERPDIKSLEGIGNLKGLTSLDLSCNKLKNLSGVEELTKLKSLTVEKNKLVNIKAIKNLTGLEDLDLSFNKLTTLSGIKKLTNLKFLHVNGNQLTALSGIENLVKLGSLGVYDNKLKNLSGIEGLRNLHSLYVSGNKLVDLKGVENLINLEGLSASDNKLKKLPDLRKLIDLHDESTSFMFNKLSIYELVEKLPVHLVKNSWWINRELQLQNATRSLKLTTPASFKKIKSTTEKIVGTAQKNTIVRIKYKNKKVKSVRTNVNGVFQFKKLNLKKYKGKILTMEVLHYGGIETEYFVIKFIKFTVR